MGGGALTSAPLRPDGDRGHAILLHGPDDEQLTRRIRELRPWGGGRVADVAFVYVDSSVLVRSYLASEPGHAEARALVEGDKLLITATFTLVEVMSALFRARKAKRLPDVDVLIEKLYEEVSPDGPINLTRPDPTATESAALTIVRHYAVRTLEAMHLAVADIAARPLAEPGEQIGFATHSDAQRHAARALGFVPLPDDDPAPPPPPPPGQ